MAFDLDRARARYDGWYDSDDEYTDPERGDWTPRDEGESISHMIVREDVPDLLGLAERGRLVEQWLEAKVAEDYESGLSHGAWREIGRFLYVMNEGDQTQMERCRDKS